jgi:hypothetical protein
MKVVINTCFGGFSLSAKAVKRMAELQGRECYFFTKGLNAPYEPVSTEEADQAFMFFAFDIPNPNDVIPEDALWHEMTMEERQASNQRHEAHSLLSRDVERNDPLLIQVVEELGGGHRTGASGRCADLKIVEIPDGTDYVIEEYDGSEHIAETHRTWS